jgi:hypothetical protein
VGVITYGFKRAFGVVRPRILLLIRFFTVSISADDKEMVFVVFIFFL